MLCIDAVTFNHWNQPLQRPPGTSFLAAMDIPTLIASLPADLLRKLQLAASETDRGQVLDERLAAMSAENDEKATAARTRYRDKLAGRYSEFDWKRAMAGAPAEYTFKVPGIASYYLRPPSGAKLHTIRALASSKAEKDAPLLPMTEDEFTVVAWATAVALPDGTRRDLPTDTAERLTLLRGLPAATISRISEECSTLQTWMNVQLELSLGES